MCFVITMDHVLPWLFSVLESSCRISSQNFKTCFAVERQKYCINCREWVWGQLQCHTRELAITQNVKLPTCMYMPIEIGEVIYLSNLKMVWKSCLFHLQPMSLHNNVISLSHYLKMVWKKLSISSTLPPCLCIIMLSIHLITWRWCGRSCLFHLQTPCL